MSVSNASGNEKSDKIIDISAIISSRKRSAADADADACLSFADYKKRGDVCRLQGDTARAIESYLKAYEINDSDLDLCLDLGTALGEIHRYENAAHYLKQACALAPDDPETHYFLGMAYMAFPEPHFRHAIDCFQKCLKLDSSLTRVKIFIAEAWRALRKPDMAIEILTELIASDKNNVEALNLLAVLHLERNETKEAIDYLRQAVSADPHFATLYINLGVAYMIRGFIDMSINQFETATKLDPTDASAFYNLAHAYAMRGDPQKAEPLARRSLELDDSGLDAHILLATILTAKRDWQEAVQELSQVIERDPDNAQACGGLGHCSQELGDVDESIYWLEQAILLDKHNPEWYFYQTFNYINKNDLDQALKHINSAIAQNDTISGYFILRGDILYNMGKQRKAKQDWKNALRLSDKLTHEVETRLSGQVPQIPRQQA